MRGCSKNTKHLLEIFEIGVMLFIEHKQLLSERFIQLKYERLNKIDMIFPFRFIMFTIHQYYCWLVLLKPILQQRRLCQKDAKSTHILHWIYAKVVVDSLMQMMQI